jgi:hypothetical protein
MKSQYIVYSQEPAPTNRIYDVTLHNSYNAVQKEIKRRRLQNQLTGRHTDDWIGIRQVLTVKFIK